MCDWLVKVDTFYGSHTHINTKYKDYKWTDDYHKLLEIMIKKLIKYIKTEECLLKYGGNNPMGSCILIDLYKISCDMRHPQRSDIWHQYSKESMDLTMRAHRLKHPKK